MEKNILITMDFNETEKEKIRELTKDHQVNYKTNETITAQDMEKAHIILGNLSLRHFENTPNLEWLQLQTAGTDGYLKEGILPEKTVLTNVTGAFGESIAEYVVGAVLMVKNHFHTYIQRQKLKQWNKIDVTNLKNSTVLILGLGDIGRETAKRMKALGSYVIAVKKRKSEKPEYVDELHYSEDLDKLLPRADVFVLTIPMYDEVKHIIDKKRISLLKESAIFVNIARGKLVDQEALVDALKNKKIEAAVLDVFEKEPLPEESPLWEMDNVVVTPHNSGGFTSPMAREIIGEIMIENLENYLQGNKLRNIVDKKTGYCI